MCAGEGGIRPNLCVGREQRPLRSHLPQQLCGLQLEGGCLPAWVRLGVGQQLRQGWQQDPGEADHVQVFAARQLQPVLHVATCALGPAAPCLAQAPQARALALDGQGARHVPQPGRSTAHVATVQHQQLDIGQVSLVRMPVGDEELWRALPQILLAQI